VALGGVIPSLPSPRGGRFFWIFSLLFLGTFLGVVEAVALPVGLQNVDAVRQSIEQCAGEPFVPQNLRPLLERQVAGEDETLAFVCPAHDVEEQFGPGLGELEVERRFVHEGLMFDIAVGAKGSTQQLILSTIYYIDQPAGVMPADYCCVFR